MKAKPVLIVSIYFAPASIVGAKRFTFLAAEMERGKDFDVFVLTSDDKGKNKCDSPTKEVPGKVTRVRGILPYPIKRKGAWSRAYMRLMESFIAVPDPFCGWMIPAIFQGLRLIRKNNIETIISTGPPATILLVGAILARLTGKKLILDYRDPWTGYAWPQKKLLAPWLQRRLERWSVRQASALVFVTEKMVEYFQNHFGDTALPPRFMIPNGFDDSTAIEPIVSDEPGRKVILYAGSFYGERSIWLVLTPLLDLISRGIVGRQSVRLHVFGSIPENDKKKIKKEGVEDLVREHAPVGYEEIFRRMKGADILFLPSGRDFDYAVPFKFYDYLRVQRPILAIAPRNSAVASLMKDIDCGVITVISLPVSIRNGLEVILQQEKPYFFSGIEKYRWGSLAEEYRKVIWNSAP